MCTLICRVGVVSTKENLCVCPTSLQLSAFSYISHPIISALCCEFFLLFLFFERERKKGSKKEKEELMNKCEPSSLC